MRPPHNVLALQCAIDEAIAAHGLSERLVVRLGPGSDVVDLKSNVDVRVTLDGEPGPSLDFVSYEFLVECFEKRGSANWRMIFGGVLREITAESIVETVIAILGLQTEQDELTRMWKEKIARSRPRPA